MSDADTVLLDRASNGDNSAVSALLTRHRSRLRKMLKIHVDSGLLRRVDPSDLVQETLADAAKRLPEYLRKRPLPFYPWLRQLAWDRLVHARYQHLKTQKRDVKREDAGTFLLPDQSAVELANHLVAKQISPSERMIREEMQTASGPRLSSSAIVIARS